ncbi:ClpXP protease specificity-enhancing factor SspB [Alsobacter sp. SYSU M60028]|uniref:ClpXP protease specificity-enhancing factor SspB n=1 Tax=Alsobacter ponti TaxID=2962936 RepID=A0ABT1L6Y0_9HYPH|nr:ClpXP protease specificity-enhancing factor SspB [Alsobacter ponti]MCP8937201.1 ClpXP protease specificity-enhancing factor SspB [Alsobacter ponti]
MPQDLIRYDLLVQEALKGVVRKILTDAAVSGLPGDHHFFISFRTTDPGVRISARLREKYPEEITIVLQHQFWDLIVTEHTFEVGLSFSGIPERLLVPFDALTGFFDPSVQFGLKFDLSGAEPADNDEEDAEEAEAERPAPSPPTSLPSPAARRHEAKEAPAGDKAKGHAKGDAKASSKPDAKSTKAPAGATPAEDGKPAEVVSLDAFRKKP